MRGGTGGSTLANLLEATPHFAKSHQTRHTSSTRRRRLKVAFKPLIHPALAVFAVPAPTHLHVHARARHNHFTHVKLPAKTIACRLCKDDASASDRK